MAFFNSLDYNSNITDITFYDRKRLGPLDRASHRIMRGKSTFSIAQKETMAAFVSGLNACSFCYGSHVETAKQFGVSPSILEELLNDIDSSSIDGKMKPLYKYLKKLTESPSSLIDQDANDVYFEGWTEEDLHEVILIGCLFNFYNRLLDGHGVKGRKEIYLLGGEQLSKRGYKVPWFIGLIRGVVRKTNLKKLENFK